MRFRFLNPEGPLVTVPALKQAVQAAIKNASGDNIEIVSTEIHNGMAS